MGAGVALSIACLAVSGAPAQEMRAEPREETVQFALENVVSGTPVSARDGAAGIVVRPLKTWKRVSGHWCRRFELVVTEPGAAPARREATRCREDGSWKPLAGE